MSAERSVSNRIFIDTLFVITLINRRDQYHPQALDLAEQFEGRPLLVTDAVLLEIGNALARNYKQEAVAIIEQFLAADEVEVVHLTPQLFAQGFTLYKSHQDKVWGVGGLHFVHCHARSRGEPSLDLRPTFCAGGFSGLDAGAPAHLTSHWSRRPTRQVVGGCNRLIVGGPLLTAGVRCFNLNDYT
jgi:predicted nucleic acid-binding protein